MNRRVSLPKALFQADSMGALLKAAMGVHTSRKTPPFPAETFPDGARKNGLTKMGGKNPGRKLACFAGCTGKYLFPEVPKAVVDVFRHNGFEVYFPEQKCCGMPPFLEGDREVTLDFVRFNVEPLSEVVEEGCDIVCSCPTCSYMLRTVMGEGACPSSLKTPRIRKKAMAHYRRVRDEIKTFVESLPKGLKTE